MTDLTHAVAVTGGSLHVGEWHPDADGVPWLLVHGVTASHPHPSRQERAVLVDGGLPLDLPPGMAPEVAVRHVLYDDLARVRREKSGLSAARRTGGAGHYSIVMSTEGARAAVAAVRDGV